MPNANARLDNHIAFFGSRERAERVIRARNRANRLGRNHPDHPHAEADYFRIRSRALEERMAEIAAKLTEMAAGLRAIADTMADSGLEAEAEAA
jgi:hypothetical protein